MARFWLMCCGVHMSLTRVLAWLLQAGKEASRSETESRARLGGSDVSVSMRASDEQSVLSDQSAGKIPPFPPEPTAGPSPS
eukprot:2673686-Rhodomonas_salina.1